MSETSASPESSNPELEEARDDFIAQWGSLASAWGINRTMAQIHALLLSSTEPMSTDQIMENLKISRGNAHGNLRELVGWSLVRTVIKKGERKEFFEAEREVWKMVCTVARERKRRELAPAMQVLKSCSEKTKSMKTKEAKDFHAMLEELSQVVNLFDRLLDQVAASEESKVASLLRKLF